MRFLLAATRSLISFATTAHIASLRATVWVSDRKVAAAMKLSDAAKVAREAATNAYYAATSNETNALRDNGIVRAAARADAANYRRDVWF